MRLNALQEALEAYLTTGESAATPELLEQIQGSTALPASDGLMIYHNAYRARLLSVMREDFPALHHWMGGESFEQLALAYITAWPPRHFSLRWLGETLPEFISHYVPEPQLSPMRELAGLEWAFTLAFDAPDAQPLSLEAMSRFSAKDWTSLRICLNPSVEWLPLQRNTIEIWKAAKAETEIPETYWLSSPLDCLVWRHQLVCRYRTLERPEANALEFMRDGGSFAELCETLLDEHREQAPLRAATWLKQWVSEGLLLRTDEMEWFEKDGAK
ncbi:DNA-binding domain-containing protein [Pseudomonas sp. LS1212]|uniref:HvfC/BufC N-terminal domain-containing protein n=1 Tax=Pseudomonas sp. LS1212 TaxID=2972478 RepID=UPI00215BF246|nr:DNA-binding domain-containing protein [Pseudomonas sp. LS1212]UVJ41911.1 DNA-binding domain-containing protein [Pseudomonas sp. LS1212]